MALPAVCVWHNLNGLATLLICTALIDGLKALVQLVDIGQPLNVGLELMHTCQVKQEVIWTDLVYLELGRI